jgi:signal peptidase
VGRHVKPGDGRSLTDRVRSQARWLLLDAREALVACLIGMLLASVVPVLLGWKSTVVVSGSMMPRIRPGDVITAAPAPDRVKVGTVVLVDDPAHPGELLMHRVIRFDDADRMITKGDANQTADTTPVPMANLVGIPRIRIPYIGLPYLWIRQGRYVPVVAAGILVLALLLWRPRRRRPHDESTPPSHRRSLLNGPLDADPHRIRPVPSGAPIRNAAALISDSNPAALQPNWTPEAAAAVSTGER